MSFTGSESAKMTAYAYGQASEAIREIIDKLARRHDLSLYLRMKWRAFSSDGSSSMNWDDLVSAAAQLDSRD
jgi:hypothetical protein